MAKKPLLYLIYSDLSGALTGIGKKTFLGRPQNAPTELANFLVIESLTTLYGTVAGDSDVMGKCFGTISVYCKSKTDGTLNVESLTDMTQRVMDVFPINGEHISATRPKLLMRGEDGYGYQVTQIAFNLRTKFNARDI